MNRRNIAPWMPLILALGATTLTIAAVVSALTVALTSSGDPLFDSGTYGEAIYATAEPSPAVTPRTINPQKTAQSVNGREPILTPTALPTPVPTAAPELMTPAPEPARAPAGELPPPPPPPPPAPVVTAAPTSPPPPGEFRADVTEQLYQLLNNERTSHGVPAVNRHPILEAAAQHYAQLVWLHNPYNLDHWLDGGPGDRAWSRGYCCGVGEILVESEGSAASMVELWMGSPPHHDVILDPQYVSFGVACYSGTWYDNQGNANHPIICVGDFGSG